MPKDIGLYKVVIRGELGKQCQNCLESLEVNLDSDGNTEITKGIIDQSALFGVLKKLNSLGLELLKVEKL